MAIGDRVHWRRGTGRPGRRQTSGARPPPTPSESRTQVADYPDELWRSVADLSGLLLSKEDQETTLKRVADLAVRCIVDCDAVGVTLFRDGAAVTRAATGGLVYEIDHYQYDIGEGPCLSAILDREMIEVQDMATEMRWPRFCKHAAE